MTRPSRATPARTRLRPAVGAVLLACGLALSACGGSDEGEGDAAGSTAAAPDPEEMAALLESTASDASSIADAMIAEHESTGAYPDSADGLGELSEGNEVGGYEPSETSAEVCVEHVVDGEAVAFTSWYVDATAEPARASELSSGENTGCL